MLEKMITVDQSRQVGAISWIDRCLSDADPGQPILVIDGKELSYKLFAQRVRKLTRVLGELCNAQAGVALCTRSPVEMAQLFVAALRGGIPVISLNPDLTSAERRLALTASRVSHVVLDRDILDQAPLPEGLTHTAIETEAAATGLVGRLLGGGASKTARAGLAKLIDAAEPVDEAVAPDPDSTAMLLMTSGTTSQPKVVELSHRNLEAQLKAFAEVYGLDRDARILNPLPLHFTDGIMHGPLHALFAGATLYRPSSFQFEQLEDLVLSIYRDRISHFITVPTIMAMIMGLPASFDDAFDTPEFKMIRSSGDRLPLPLWEAFENRFGVTVTNTYGLSETVSEATYCAPADRYKRGTIGTPVGCEVEIRDADGNAVDVGVEGELTIRGDIIAKGYRASPELTAVAFQNGWFRTGDLAIQDADGFLTIMGRSSGIIISGGINIQPADISDTLLRHPSVADAVAFGVSDPTFGEKVVAAVTLAPTYDATDDAKADLIAHCREHLAPHKVPRDLMMLDQIPRTPSGKALIGELQKRAQTAGASGMKNGVPLEEDVLVLAAEVFNCPENELSLTSEPKTTVGWDSFAHVQLILAAETRYDIKIPARDFLGVKTLGDLARLLEKTCGQAA